MIKLCECGCGNPAPIAKKTKFKKGHIKGNPMRFICGHNGRGSNNFLYGKHHSLETKQKIGAANWKGGKTITKNGYILKLEKEHPRANRGYVLEHILIAEKALGKSLSHGVEVHHINKNNGDNEGKNLIICENREYHCLLHQRQRAYEACGHANWRKCPYCKEYDDPINMSARKKQRFHKKCRSADT